MREPKWWTERTVSARLAAGVTGHHTVSEHFERVLREREEGVGEPIEIEREQEEEPQPRVLPVVEVASKPMMTRENWVRSMRARIYGGD